MGKKLKLDADSVRIESFDTGKAAERTGTVAAHITADPNAGCGPTEESRCVTDCGCSGNWTCPGSYPGTCDGGSTCYGTCHTGQCYCL
ncbi:MAG TPA: hypothetical protein VFJ16_14125 [Longimicrobium sp.]|nr:hypothetical protein [Longimicrobium sp.]